MSAELVSARLEWERAHREFEDVAKDPVDAERVGAQLAAVSAELRRRIGGTFTLRELADEYVAADRWAREVLADQALPDWSRAVALIEGAAFHLYARGAVDWAP